MNDLDTTELDAPAGAAPGPRRIRLVVAVALAVVVVDQLTKWVALRRLTDGPVHVIWTLRFNLVRNTGAAFSMGSGRGVGPWISVLALAVVIGLSLGYTSRLRVGAVAAGLIAGGAVGNLLDRAFRGEGGFMSGAVVDFIDLQWWPVWNVADASIVVGGLLLAFSALRAELAP